LEDKLLSSGTVKTQTRLGRDNSTERHQQIC